MTTFIIFLACVSAYLLPAIIAANRGHRQKIAILVLNIFLGWTFLGWIGALVWASTAVDPTRRGPAY